MGALDPNPRCQPKNPKRRSPTVYWHWQLFHSSLQRAGYGSLLARQFHKLHSIFSNPSLQFELQGFYQEIVPKEVQSEDRIPYVLCYKYGIWRIGCRWQFVHRVSTRLRSNPPCVRCWQWQEDFQWFG